MPTSSPEKTLTMIPCFGVIERPSCCVLGLLGPLAPLGGGGRGWPLNLSEATCHQTFPRTAHESGHEHPVGHRAGRPVGRGATLAAGLRGTAQTGGPKAGPGIARSDAPGHVADS